MLAAVVALLVLVSTTTLLVALDARSGARAADERAADLARRLTKVEASVAAAVEDGGRLEQDNQRLAERLADIDDQVRSAPDTAALADRAKKSVFAVETDAGGGTAWVIASEGGRSTLVTNYHVIADGWVAKRPNVRLKQGDGTWNATVTDVAEGDDLALLTTDSTFPALERASGRPSVGSPVLAVGSPLGLEGSVSTGVVSSVRKEDGVEYIQFTAPISPGNSGGPVIDGEGRVVGIATWKAVFLGAEGLGFAVPVDELCARLVRC